MSDPRTRPRPPESRSSAQLYRGYPRAGNPRLGAVWGVLLVVAVVVVLLMGGWL